MINQLFRLSRPLFVLDTEATGTNVERDRICEIGFQQWTSEGMVQEWRSLVNPCVPMPEAVVKVHGITDEKVQGCQRCERSRAAHMPPGPLAEPTRECEGFKPWPLFKQLAPSFAKGFIDCDFAGMNVRYDLRLFAAEMARAGVAWSYAGARILDAKRLEALAHPRDLGSLHKKYVGHRHDGAHGALSDVWATTTVLVHQLQANPEALPYDLETLHEMQWPGWIDSEGKFKFIDGVPCFSHWSRFSDRPMREADSGFWDWVLKGEFSPEIKQIATEAKLGRFPKE